MSIIYQFLVQVFTTETDCWPQILAINSQNLSENYTIYLIFVQNMPISFKNHVEKAIFARSEIPSPSIFYSDLTRIQASPGSTLKLEILKITAYPTITGKLLVIDVVPGRLRDVV